MHQRRYKRPAEATRQRLMRELQGGWRTVRELAGACEVDPSTIRYALLAMAQTQVIFARKQTQQFQAVKVYRIYPEARGVQRV